ncbi:cytochrome P450 [Micromonospora coxensis]|uniref:Cytochrome P450 n=1 Tax=Micromonospora coxensis TaxID=356852 RepID=A0A1C5H6B7_9ACTN|nr:cytochrome P450 [Micromonospora coxensis]SCG41530.1 Cytochrome P450 [Micromonospora coxensis]
MTVSPLRVAAPPDTPPCAPPAPDATGATWTVTRHADVRAGLVDPAFGVPQVEPGPPGTLGWLRATVARFSGPERHPPRRAATVTVLADLDPDLLAREAARLTVAALDRRADRPARDVPLRVLAAGLGLADPAAAVPAVAVVAAAYQPGADPTAVRRADDAVAALVANCPAGPEESTAHRIGLLVQACDATAGLIDAAARRARSLPATVSTPDLLGEVLRLDPPVRATRRIATTAAALGGRPIPAGAVLLLRFDAANRDPAVFTDPDRFTPGRPNLTFGVGAHGCPGDRHALALAAAVVDVLRSPYAGAPARPTGTREARR